MANERFFIEDSGFEELFNELSTMGVKGERAKSRALKAGGKVFLDLALANVNYSGKDYGSHLRDAMKVSAVKIGDGGESYVSVGTYLSGGKYRNGVYWGHIVEGGHYIVNKGKVRGYVTARPFMQPAYDKGGDAATKAMGDIVFKAMGIGK